MNLWQKLTQRRTRERLRRELLRYRARELADMGFDPVLVSEGVGAWPWRPVPEDGWRQRRIASAQRRLKPSRRNTGGIARIAA